METWSQYSDQLSCQQEIDARRDRETYAKEVGLVWELQTKINGLVNSIYIKVANPVDMLTGFADCFNRVGIGAEEYLIIVIHGCAPILQELSQCLHLNVSKIKTLREFLLNNILDRWKLNQQQQANRYQDDEDITLNDIRYLDNCYGNLIKLIRLSRQTANNAALTFKLNKPNNFTEDYNKIAEEANNILKATLRDSLIVEKQPGQLLKKGNKFYVRITLLGATGLGLDLNYPVQVTMCVINEKEARDIWAVKPKPTKGLLGHTALMAIYGPNVLSAEFKKCVFNTIERPQPKRNKKHFDSVLDEKHALLFCADVIVDEGQQQHELRVMSLPVVLLTHANQECSAWATISWDNAFSRPGRIPFEVPNKVPWGHVALLLKTMFYQISRGHLSENNLKFLREKFFRSETDAMSKNWHVSWFEFCKEHANDKFSFWEWFYTAAKMIETEVELWNKQYIIGFISRSESEDILRPMKPGTFLLRFSESELGGISAVFKNGENQFVHLLMSAKILKDRPLRMQLIDIEDLVTLYPEVPKTTAFLPEAPDNIPPADKNDRYRAVVLKAVGKSLTEENQSKVTSSVELPNSTEFNPSEELQRLFNSQEFMEVTDNFPYDILNDVIFSNEMEMITGFETN